MTSSLRRVGQLPRIQLPGEIVGSGVSEPVDPVSDILQQAGFREGATSIADMLTGEANPTVLGNQLRRARALGFDEFENPVVGLHHPVRREAYRHGARVVHECLSPSFKSTAAIRIGFLPRQGVTIRSCSITVLARTTRGPVRSDANQKRTGAGTPARDGSDRTRTMLPNAGGTENGIGLSTTSGAGGAAA